MLMLPAAALTLASDTITAGDSSVRGDSLLLGTTIKQLVLEDSAGRQVVGRLVQELSAATIDGRKGVLSVQTFDLGGKQTVDSSFADRRTLAPILQRSHNTSRVMTLDFTPRRVTGTVVPTTGDRKSIDHAVARPTFDANVADLVYAALPLADGFSTVVPVYIYEEGGLVWNDVSVSAAAPVAGEAVWLVRVHSASRDVEYWIGRRSHAVLRSRYGIAPGRSLVIERI